MKTNFLKNQSLIKSLAIVLVASLFLASCSDDNEDVIVQPDSNPVAATSSEIMAIVFHNYPLTSLLCALCVLAT